MAIIIYAFKKLISSLMLNQKMLFLRSENEVMDDKLKIVIADDEPMVCVVIQDSIDFDKIGLELIGVAYDGLSLLDIIVQQKPDIVITDICMPGMDGLDLIEEVSKKKIECKFIIISGYSEFDYAHKAVKYKVEDYLLKPINENELNETLINLRNSIIVQREHQNADLWLVEDNKKNKEALKKLLISNIINNRNFSKDLDLISNEYGVSAYGGIFQGVIVKLDILENTLENGVGFETLQSKIVKIFNQIFGSYCYEIFDLVDNSILYLAINYDIKLQKTIFEAYKEFFNYAKNITDIFKGLKITLGIGNPYSDILDLKKSFEEAKKTIYYRITMGLDRIIYYSQIHFKSNCLDIHERTMLLERVRKSFESINIDEYEKCITKLFNDASSNVEEIVELCFEIVSMFFDINQSLGNEIEKIEYQRSLMHQGIINSVSLIQLRKHMINEIKNLMLKLLDDVREKNSKPVRETIRFIKEHYHEDLDLESVSKAIYFNPVYISNIFKKETGENFIDFLNKYRIEVAKEMLRTSNYNINEVSKAVGFNDSKYFSKLFRKFVGLKPSEYRRIYGG